MVGMGLIAISVRLYQDVCMERVEIDPILVNVKKHGKEFCVMSQFAGNWLPIEMSPKRINDTVFNSKFVKGN